jgi:hypothetical protein
MGLGMLQQWTRAIRRYSSSTEIRTLVIKVTYAKDTFEGNWSLEWTMRMTVWLLFKKFGFCFSGGHCRGTAVCSKWLYLGMQHSQELLPHVTGMQNYIFNELLHYFLNRTLVPVLITFDKCLNWGVLSCWSSIILLLQGTPWWLCISLLHEEGDSDKNKCRHWHYPL